MSENQVGLFGISEDFSELALSLDRKYLTDSTNTFLIRAAGDAMAPVINDRDILVVNTEMILAPGMIGAFYYNNKPLFRQWQIKGSTRILHAYNSNYKDITVRSDDEIDLFGVVRSLCRDLL